MNILCFKYWLRCLFFGCCNSCIILSMAAQEEARFRPDISINKFLYLHADNDEHERRWFGKDARYDEECQCTIYTNGVEYLIPSAADGCAGFAVGYLKNFPKSVIANDLKMSVEQFYTESGIKLGLTYEEVIAIKGKRGKLKMQNGYKILTYRLANPKSPFLKKYNMPEYTAVFKFENNLLIRFSFGFPVP